MDGWSLQGGGTPDTKSWQKDNLLPDLLLSSWFCFLAAEMFVLYPSGYLDDQFMIGGCAT